MKTTKILKLITFVFFIGIIATSCVDSDDYSIPNIEDAAGDTFDTSNDIPLSQIKQMYSGDLVDFSEAGNGGRMTTSGYVVSNDEAGNFYKTIIIQDSPENPSAAIQINIDATSLYAQYKPGQKVYITLYDADLKDASGISLPSLGMANYHGVLQIGIIDGNSTGRIGLFDYPYYLTRSSEIATMVPTIITPSQFDDSYINMLIQIDDMQLASGEVGQGYANYTNTYTANRHLKNCIDDSETVLRNSGYSDFKNTPFPAGRGSIVCVFSKYNSNYQLFVRDTNDVIFDGDRCDPVFEETFNSATDGTILNTVGWINYAEEGSELWMEDVYNGNGYARFSAYNTGDSSNIGWLISPSFDLDAQDGELLSFQTQHAYPDSGHEPLAVLISTDFDGTEAGITTATWTELTFDVSYIVDFGSWFTFTDSGQIDISGYSGTGYIAFRYTGSDTADQNMTLDVDNIEISVP